MDEHGSWFQYLPGLSALVAFFKRYLGRGQGDAMHFTVGPIQANHFTLDHVLTALFVVVVVSLLAWRFRTVLRRKKDQGLLPDRGFSLTNVLELLGDAMLGFMSDVMGEKNAKRFLPLIGSVGLFVFAGNILSVIPGFQPPTTTLKTNLAVGLSVFVLTHYYGIRAHGVKSYAKHFLGPIWYFAPVFLLIELISHIARPISLALRLMGNMVADHKVAFIFFSLVHLIVPLPFLVLGTVVSLIQAYVFCLLSTIYINMAIAHEDHDEEHHAHTALDAQLATHHG